MDDRAPGWRQAPDGRWYPPVNERTAQSGLEPELLAELAELVNSGVLTVEIDESVDDPQLAV